MHMLSSTVLTMHDFDTLKQRAIRIATTHVKYGVPIDAYFDFLAAIESALQSKPPTQFTRKIRFAFRLAFSRITAEIQKQHLKLLKGKHRVSGQLSRMFQRQEDDQVSPRRLASDDMRQSTIRARASKAKRLSTERWRHALSEILSDLLSRDRRIQLLEQFLHEGTAAVTLRYFLLLEYNGDAAVDLYLACDKYRTIIEPARAAAESYTSSPSALDEELEKTVLGLCHEIAEPVDPSLPLFIAKNTREKIESWLANYEAATGDLEDNKLKLDQLLSNDVLETVQCVQKDTLHWLFDTVIEKFKSSLICRIMLNPHVANLAVSSSQFSSATDLSLSLSDSSSLQRHREFSESLSESTNSKIESDTYSNVSDFDVVTPNTDMRAETLQGTSRSQ
ncbi:MAG: hypothetical protein MHM6MM_000202 [Cercozoa sp. M6MM]